MSDKRILSGNERPTSRLAATSNQVEINPRQQRLYEALVGVSCDLASMYLGALAVLNDTQNPDRLALAAHGLRELLGHMPLHLGLTIDFLGQKLSDKVREINKCWEKASSQLADVTPGTQIIVSETTATLFRKLNKLLAESQSIAPGQEQELANVLRYLDGSKRILPSELEKRNVAQWRNLAGFLVRVLHHKSEPTEDEFRYQLSALESFLLDQLKPRTFEEHAELDALIALGEPTQRDVKRAVELFSKRPVNYAYFFDNLPSPVWIEPLRKEGRFVNAPEPEVRDGTISIPPWPESKYLARIAGQSREVAEQILQIAVNVKTENITVHQDFAGAALAMPPDLAAKWLKTEGKWVRRQQSIDWLLPDAYGKLVSYMAKNGEPEQAIRFCKVLLAIMWDNVDIADQDEYSTLPYAKPRSRLADFAYERMLEERIPDLMAAEGKATLRMLCGQLANALIHPSKADEIKRDHSFIWHPEIEHDEERGMADVKNHLVSAVRDASVQLRNIGLFTVEELVKLLESYKWTVFRRIALHCLRVFRDTPVELVSQRLVKHSAFDDLDIGHEYSLLLEERFGDLQPADQKTILSWIDRGPHYLDKHEESYEKAADAWRRDWLSLILPHLDADWRHTYDSLIARLGPAKNPAARPFPITSWMGPRSPIRQEELAQMDIRALIAYLQSWQPAGDPVSPSPEGLGRELETIVSDNPKRFAGSAVLFCGIEEPTYITALFSGLREALRQGRTFAWRPVIDLAGLVVHRPREIPGRSEDRHRDADPHWGWSRKAIAALLKDGFTAKKGAMLYQFRERIWKLLEALVKDPNPTPEYEHTYGGTNMDPATMSINTVRGIAMHASIHYALWVRRHLEKQPDAQTLVTCGLEEMPEVRAVLDEHLDVRRDPSSTVRAVYGRWLPWLTAIDEEWVRANVQRIFPQSKEEADLRDAAWETYLLYGQLYGRSYGVLAEEYSRAIDRVGKGGEDKHRARDVDHRMAEHLMSIYWWGKIGFEELGRFFTLAPAEIRGHALSFVGQSLAKAPPGVTPGGTERLIALWEWRLAQIESEANDIPQEDLRAEFSHFGYWFVSGAFDRDWALDQLRASVSLAKWTEPDAEVVAELADLAADVPLAAVECLAHMTEGDDDGWGIGHAWGANPRRILVTSVQSRDARAKQAAIDLINRLGQRGFLLFRDLLPL